MRNNINYHMNIPKYHAKEFHNLVHSNVFCPMKQSFIIGFKYIITFITNFPQYIQVYLMKEKSEKLKFKKFCTQDSATK